MESNCPASESDDALEGTRLHHLVAIGDCSEDLSRRALDWLESIAPIMEWEMEVPVKLLEADGKEMTRGTADAIHRPAGGSRSILVDHKFGYKIPAHEVVMRQVALYGAMLLSECVGLEEVECIARYHRYSKSIFCTVTREDVDRIVGWWTGVKARCEAEPEVYTPGDWCLYCRGRTSARCPALFREAQALSLSTVEELEPAEIERMATLLDYEERLAPFFKAAREHVRRAIQRGAVVPGWTIQPRAAARRIRDPNEVYSVLQDSLLPSDVLSACSVSVTALEQVYCDKQSQATTLPKARLKELFNARISPCLEKSGPVICLVRMETANV
jgi:hypothetical protein